MTAEQKGFTLIEALLVLSIFMIISGITVINLKPEIFNDEDEVFFIRLKTDLLYAQQYAISHQTDVSFYFRQEEFKYFLFDKTRPSPLLERTYSPNLKVYGGSLPLTLKFLADGNVDTFGNFYFKSKEKLYSVTVLIGRGRFYLTAYE
jgi:competence protein ComGD